MAKRKETCSIGTFADNTEKNKWKDPSSWPSSLHDFVNKCFVEANKKSFNTNQQTQFRNQMKNIINLAIKEDKILSNDWSKQKVPLLEDHGKIKMALFCDINKIESRNEKKATISKKHNIFGEAESDSEEGVLPTTLKRNKSINLSGSIGRLKKQKQSIPSPKTSQNKDSNPLSDKKILEERSRRFERELSTPILTASSADLISTEPVVGQNKILEKKYLRLTSQPKPETVRPLHILKKTLQLLFDRYFEGASYNYLCDQCKSLRQDLTVQNIKNDFSILAYEFHSKIAIENCDWGEFNQCQSQLKLLYDKNDLEKPNYMEFLAYRVLYYIFTENGNEVHELEAKLLEKDLDYMGNEFLEYSLDIFTSISTSNFYQLSETATDIILKNEKEEKQLQEKQEDKRCLLITDHNALLLNHGSHYFFTKFLTSILARENIRTLSSLCCGFKQLPIDLLRRLLCFKTDEKVLTFLSHNCLSNCLNEGKTTFNASQARFKVEQLKNATFRKIDIKGQV